VIPLQIKLTKPKLEVLSLTFCAKKKVMNADKLAINWQNIAQVWLQLKFAFIIQPRVFSYRYCTHFYFIKEVFFRAEHGHK